MNIIKKIISIKTVIIIIALILIVALAYFINYRLNYVNRLINSKRLDWDLTVFQNSQINGEYMGMIYEKDYDINTLPSNLVSVLAINYYISHDDTFYDENNAKDNEMYEKTISKTDMYKTLKNMFGQDYAQDLPNVEYKCGYLKTIADSYTIGSKDPESCGVFGADDKYYISYITDYYKNKKEIVVELKVGYIENKSELTNDEEENIKYLAYTNKSKEKLVNSDYDYNCIYYSESVQEYCYNGFNTYQIILKKAKDNKYHFSEITKFD